jgi:hypothetical protein
MGFLHMVEYRTWDECTTHNVVGSSGLTSLLSFTTLPSPLNEGAEFVVLCFLKWGD